MWYFKAKMHQIRFRLGRSSQRSPRPPSWIWGGPTSKGREWEGREGKGRGKGKKRKKGGRKGRGKRREGEGREGGRLRHGFWGDGRPWSDLLLPSPPLPPVRSSFFPFIHLPCLNFLSLPNLAGENAVSSTRRVLGGFLRICSSQNAYRGNVFHLFYMQCNANGCVLFFGICRTVDISFVFVQRKKFQNDSVWRSWTVTKFCLWKSFNRK